MDRWNGARVLVVGMARSGISAARLLLDNGAIPLLYDSKNISAFGDDLHDLVDAKCEFHLGEDPIKLLSNVDAVVISPGVPIDSKIVIQAKESGLPVIGELELAFTFLKGQSIAISGTNGKTTTTTLVGKILENADKKTFVAGNIGYPLSKVSLEATEEDYSVIEVSSFQLESIKTFHPYVAALLNISEDHLNRHYTMENYIALKQRLFENQMPSDIAVINYDDQVLRNMSKNIRSRVLFFSRKTTIENGAFVENGKIVFQWDGIKKVICDVEEVLIPGPHNLENALAATVITSVLSVPPTVIRHTLQSFSGVEHRIERVRVLDGVTYINDSKATNTDSTIKAVLAMTAPTVLLLGGYDKHTDFSPLCQEIVNSSNISHVVVLGETAKQIATQLKEANYSNITRAYSLEDAIEQARKLALKGGNVLLSPACASFDMFNDFEHRGECFKTLVNQLA